VRNILRTPALAADVTRLTGLTVERRAEGLALLDTGGLAERRFPAGGSVAHAALLLVGAMADRIGDPDAPPLRTLAAPIRSERQAELAAEIDAGLPVAEVLAELVDPDPDPAAEPGEAEPGAEPPRYPLLERGWLAATMEGLIARYASTFGAEWRADPPRLLVAALDLLAAHRLVEPVEGGVLGLPLLGRYRNVMFQVRRRAATLFELDPEESS
jgi:hypothetical protein